MVELDPEGPALEVFEPAFAEEAVPVLADPAADGPLAEVAAGLLALDPLVPLGLDGPPIVDAQPDARPDDVRDRRVLTHRTHRDDPPRPATIVMIRADATSQSESTASGSSRSVEIGFERGLARADRTAKSSRTRIEQASRLVYGRVRASIANTIFESSASRIPDSCTTIAASVELTAGGAGPNQASDRPISDGDPGPAGGDRADRGRRRRPASRPGRRGRSRSGGRPAGRPGAAWPSGAGQKASGTAVGPRPGQGVARAVEGEGPAVGGRRRRRAGRPRGTASLPRGRATPRRPGPDGRGPRRTWARRARVIQATPAERRRGPRSGRAGSAGSPRNSPAGLAGGVEDAEAAVLGRHGGVARRGRSPGLRRASRSSAFQTQRPASVARPIRSRSWTMARPKVSGRIARWVSSTRLRSSRWAVFRRRSQRTIWRSVAAAIQPGAVRRIRPTPSISGAWPSRLPVVGEDLEPVRAG